jgi:hypothetical protein
MEIETAILKWGGGIIARLLTLMSTAILILALVGFYKLNERFDEPIVNTQVTQGDSHLQRDCHPAIHATHSFVLTGIHPS